MIFVSFSTIPFKHFNLNSLNKFLKLFSLIVSSAISVLLVGCSASNRYSVETENSTNIELNKSTIRVLIDEDETSTFLTIQSSVYLFDSNSKLAIVNPGNTIECYNSSNEITVNINNKKFTDNYFHLESVDNNYIKFNDRSYKGSIMLASSGNDITIINYIDLEDYLTGVISKEMPLGIGTENLEALKALTICARTYATLRIQEGKSFYDIFNDTRDQVYGGKNAESPMSDQAVEQTSGMLLLYNSKPAIVFYSSTCGGHTTAVQNVFTDEEFPYLEGILDGNEPNCKISPRYEWKEVYSKHNIPERLIDAELIEPGSYTFEEININSRFDCGRVNEFEIMLEDENSQEISVKIYGNDIRGVLLTGNGKSDLWSTLFDIEEDDEVITINGKGYGHGVGLCQYGAIHLSQEGWNYEDILEYYFPGTSVGK